MTHKKNRPIGRFFACRLPSNLKLELMAYLLCLIAPLIFVGWPLFTGQVLVVDDMLTQYWPYRDLWATYVHSATLPLWNPYVFAGMPFLGDPQFAALYPLNIVFLLFPSLTAIQAYGLIAYALLSAFTYYYMRTLRRSRLAGLVAALSLSFGLFMLIHWPHVTMVHCILWLPLQLGLIERLAATRRPRYVFFLAIALALQVYSGHPQFLLYSWLVMGAYQIGHLVSARHGRRELIGCLGVATLSGILLGSLQILPSMELARASSRRIMSYGEFSDYSLRPVLLLQWLTPFLFGSPARFLYTLKPFVAGWDFEVLAYTGALPVVCLVSAFTLRRWAGWREAFWWLILTWGIVFALGRYTPFYQLVYRIPVYNLFRVAGRHLFLVSLALAMITGLRVDALLQANRKIIAWTLGGFLALAIILAVYGLSKEGADLRVHYGNGVARPELLLPLLTFALLFLVLWPFGDGSHRQRWPTRALLLGLVASDLLLTSSTVAPSLSRAKAVSHSTEFRNLPGVLSYKRERFWHLPPIAGSNNYLFARLPFATSYNPLILQRYAQLAHFRGATPTSSLLKLSRDTRESLLNLLHVGYLLVPQTVIDQPLLSSICEQQIEGFCFTDLSAQVDLQPGEQILLPLPPPPAHRVGIVSALGYSVDIPDRTPVAQLSFLDKDHTILFSFPLLAGVHTAEWAADCLPPGQEIHHRTPPAAYSWTALDTHGNKCWGHAYFSAVPIDTNLEPAYMLIQNIHDHSAFVLHGLSLERSGQMAGYNLNTGMYRAVVPSSAPDWTTASWAIYRRQPAWGHAWPVERVQAMTDTEFLQTLYAFQQRSLDLEHVAYIAPHDLSSYLQTWPDLQERSFDVNAHVQVTEQSPNSLTLRVQSRAPALILLSEIYYPGWSVWIDSEESDILRIDHTLRGVIVPEGLHTVHFIYRPRSLYLGIVLSVLAMALMATYIGRVTNHRSGIWKDTKRQRWLKI